MRRALGWLTRGLWAAAWAGWAWLGVGLYRELPREFGPPVCTLPVNLNGDQLIGFVGDTNQFAVLRKKKDEICTSVEAFDAESGRLVYSAPGPRDSDYISSIRRGRRDVLIARERPGPDWDWTRGLHVLDLRTGQWKRFSEREILNAACHPGKPWIVVLDAPDRSSTGGRVVVVDWQTGKETVVRPPAQDVSQSGVFFIADGDRVVVPLKGQTGSLRGPRQLEVWNLSVPPVREKTLEGAPAGRVSSYSTGSRIVVAGLSGESWFDVYDLRDGRILLSQPPTEKRQPGRSKSFIGTHPILSADGRRVLGGVPPAIWEVDTGRVVWRASAMEWMAIGDSETGTIYIPESWHGAWMSWLPNLRYETNAIRDFDGRLIVRTSDQAKIQPFLWNASRTYAVANDGRVYRLPLSVNWMLLAFCQMVLATPMVLAWAVLFWRGRRRRAAA